MRKLIIGCGYLGRRVAQAWLAAGDEVVALTRSMASARELEKIGVQPVLGDVTQPETLRALPDATTLLYAVGFDRASGMSQRHVYVTGLENALAQVANRVERLISISSTSVYGQSRGESVDETSLCRPTRPNGQVCLEAERVVWQHFPPPPAAGVAAVAGGANLVRPAASILRLAGIYGPGRLLSRVELLCSGGALSGNPDAYLNLIHVDDAVRAVIACEKRGRTGELFLVCDDAPILRKEYFGLLARLVGAPAVRFEQGDPASTELTNFNKRCQNRKLRDELKVALAYPTIFEGLPDALGEFLSGPNEA